MLREVGKPHSVVGPQFMKRGDGLFQHRTVLSRNNQQQQPSQHETLNWTPFKSNFLPHILLKTQSSILIV